MKGSRLFGFFVATLLLVFAPLGLAEAAPAPPRLEIRGPASHDDLIERLENHDPSVFVPIMELLGLDDAGPTIVVKIAPEGSVDARRAPSWGLAYALGELGQVVLIPSRIAAEGSRGYPDNSLEAVLRHEVAHVLIARAARRRPIPRWFNEGLAVFAVHGWGIYDRPRLMWATLRRGPSLADLEAGFRGGAGQAGRAYALAAAFVRFTFDHFGEGTAAGILRQVGQGESFEDAFRSATGVQLNRAESEFWQQLDFWNKWIPFLTSSTTLWAAIAALALVAFKRRRDRDAEMQARWDEEELENATTNGWVH